MTRQSDICPDCGSDRFKSQDWDKMFREQQSLETRYRKGLADHGLERAEWHIRELKLSEGNKYLQQKIRRQAKAITRLEEKLKQAGQQPYWEDNDGQV